MDRPLSILEARVLGCLIEKDITTPAYYPLSLNALVAACNQKSNRSPELEVAETEVLRALDSLRDRKLAWEMSSSVGRTLKYRHNATDTLSLTPHQTAILCELLLRGAQTTGELRTHASRLADFADAQQIGAVLGELMARTEAPLVTKLPPGSGQREQRYAHLLCGPVAAEAAPASYADSARLVVTSENERIAKLEAETAALREEIANLRTELTTFISQFK
jgi:uncharacterized protein YceH (UPF0502 family)